MISLSPCEISRYFNFFRFVGKCLLLPADMCHLRHFTLPCIQLSHICQSVSFFVYLFHLLFFCLSLNNVLCHCDDLSDRLCFVFAVCNNQPKQGEKSKHCVGGSTASPCAHSAVLANSSDSDWLIIVRSRPSHNSI